MRPITIIQEANVLERYPIDRKTFTCLESVWLFDGDWKMFTDTHDNNLKQYATKLIGPVTTEVANDLARNLSEALRGMGFDVLHEDMADD